MSCTDYKREMFYCIDEIRCPWIIIDVTNGTDTMTCMTSTTYLYNHMNVRTLNSYMAFSDYLYTRLYSKGKPLLVSSDFYETLTKDEVKEVHEIKKLYDRGGINDLLVEFPEGEYLASLMSRDYASFKFFVYLCWQNDTFWFIPEPYYIAIYWSKSWLEKDTKLYKRIINKIRYLYQREKEVRYVQKISHSDKY